MISSSSPTLRASRTSRGAPDTKTAPVEQRDGLSRHTFMSLQLTLTSFSSSMGAAEASQTKPVRNRNDVIEIAARFIAIRACMRTSLHPVTGAGLICCGHLAAETIYSQDTFKWSSLNRRVVPSRLWRWQLFHEQRDRALDGS